MILRSGYHDERINTLAGLSVAGEVAGAEAGRAEFAGKRLVACRN